MGALVGLDVFETAFGIADRVEFLSGGTAVGGASNFSGHGCILSGFRAEHSGHQERDGERHSWGDSTLRISDYFFGLAVGRLGSNNAATAPAGSWITL